MPKRYWDTEEPMIADTGKNVLRYFQKAQKLQVSNPYWEDKDGKRQNGKTVTLDVAAAAESSEAVKMFRAVLADIEQKQAAE